MAGGGGGAGGARGGVRAGRVLSVQSHVVRGHCGNKVRCRGFAAARPPAPPLSLPSPAFRPSLAQGGARGGKLRGLSPACGELTMRCTPARAGPGAATRTRGG